MKRNKRLWGILFIITALIITQLPVSEVDAATSASDFRMEGTTLVKYRGTEKSVSVPDTVEIIGEGAFENNTSVELVVLPKSVKKIEAYAFWGCDSLEKVILGKGLTEVGDFAFTKCQGLKDMSIPDNVRNIGIQAFADCVNLENISISPEVTSIHDTAFDGCSKLVFHCEEGSFADKYSENFYEKQKEMPEYEDVPDYPANEPDSAPEPEIPIVTIPSIPPVSDEDNSSLLGSTMVVGNQAVVFIDNTSPTVFSSDKTEGTDSPGEEALTETVLTSPHESISKYSIVDGRLVADQAYYRNNEIRSVALPSGIVEIGQFTFARSLLESISLPDGVENICYGAFYHCDALKQVELPQSIMNVAPKAFSHTLWVDNFLENGEGGSGDFLISGGVLVAYRGNSTQVTVPEGVRVIAAEAFMNHSEMENLILPESLLVVGEGAFEGCSGLKNLTLGAALGKIKDRAFAGCSLVDLKLPAGVVEIGLKAFDDTVQLSFSGEMPDMTYEASAQRLSNEKYRNYGERTEDAGVSVTGAENMSASLTGANKRYTLSVVRVEQSSEMERAFFRNLQTSIPEGAVLYDLSLTDSSNIPLTKLGKQLLTVTMPVPEAFGGQELRVAALDRNGQLELIASEVILLDGVESVRFQTNHVSLIAVYGTGVSSENVRIVNMSAPKGEEGMIAALQKRPLLIVKWLIIVTLFIIGIWFALRKQGTNKLLRHKI